MKAWIITLLLMLAPGAHTPSANPASVCDSKHPLRVLFIGNSLIYVQNVPRLVEQIASSLSGPCIETAMIVSGGATLEDHWAADSVARRIKEGGWTHVVLNDQSSFGEGWWLEGKARVGTSGKELAEFAGRFARIIREAGAQPLLLAHWANADATPADQQVLGYHFARVARATGSRLIPAGATIKRLQKDAPSINPYLEDNHHLSPAGAYLEALIIYSTLTQHSPVGAVATVDGPKVEINRGTVFSDSIVRLVDLSSGDATKLQRIALSVHTDARAAYTMRAPRPLSAEFPTVPAGDVIDPASVRRTWRGMTRALPVSTDDSVAVELRIGLTGGDSIFLRSGPVTFKGAASVQVNEKLITVKADVTAPNPRGRGTVLPLNVTMRASVRGAVMTGVAKIEQRYGASMSSFDAIGRFQLR